jgi:uncharacterized membrane protein
MELDLAEWLKLLLRWAHVFAAILWVGTTYFFTWLDGRFGALEKQSTLDPGERAVWMVHSGGFYRVEKQKVPQVMPEKLHWFRWEAAITWLSGLLLFFMIYYHGGYMVELDEPRISQAQAISLSVALLVLSWPIYNLLWFQLVRNERLDFIWIKWMPNERLGVVLSFTVLTVLGWFLCRVMSGRAAYLQIGGMLGTIMAANVWMRILPVQRRMVAALKAGQTPNQRAAEQAKACSRHNTFIVVPVVFIMISNHFPTITYGYKYNWVVLSLLILGGWGAAKVLRRV